jgi:hypothetical protein
MPLIGRQFSDGQRHAAVPGSSASGHCLLDGQYRGGLRGLCHHVDIPATLPSSAASKSIGKA